MHLDRATGNITLSNGISFDGQLREDEFLNQNLHDPAHAYNPGTPWFYYPFIDGKIEDFPLWVTPCFHQKRLDNVTLSVATNVGGWDSYSLEAEEQAQLIHTRWLRSQLGEPHEIKPRPLRDLDSPALSTIIAYTFPWGTVHAGHDPRSGNTDVILRYQ